MVADPFESPATLWPSVHLSEVGAEEMKQELYHFWRSIERLVGMHHHEGGAWFWSEGSDDDMPDGMSRRSSSQRV